MFQTCEVKMAKMLAASRPSASPRNRPRKMVVVTVRNPRMGRLWRKSSTGIMTFSARLDLAASVA